MPTSRYCDHTRCAISASLSRAASGDPGRTRDRSSPMIATTALRTDSAFAGSPRACSSMTRSSMLDTNVTPAALIAARSQGARNQGVRVVATVRRRIGERRRRRARCAAGRAPRGLLRPDRAVRADPIIVGARCERSKTPSAVTRTTRRSVDVGQTKARPTSMRPRVVRRAGWPRASSAVESAFMGLFLACAAMASIIGGRSRPGGRVLLHTSRCGDVPIVASLAEDCDGAGAARRIWNRAGPRARRLRRHHGDARDRLGQQLLEGARERPADARARLELRQAGDGAGRHRSARPRR